MNCEYPAATVARCKQLAASMDAHIYSQGAEYRGYLPATGNPTHTPPIIEALQEKSRTKGLWNLFLPAAQVAGGGRAGGAALNPRSRVRKRTEARGAV